MRMYDANGRLLVVAYFSLYNASTAAACLLPSWDIFLSTLFGPHGHWQ